MAITKKRFYTHPDGVFERMKMEDLRETCDKWGIEYEPKDDAKALVAEMRKLIGGQFRAQFQYQ